MVKEELSIEQYVLSADLKTFVSQSIEKLSSLEKTVTELKALGFDIDIKIKHSGANLSNKPA